MSNDRDSLYGVMYSDNRGRPVWSVMRGSIVLARYFNQDAAYRVLDALTDNEVHETKREN